MSLWRTQKSHLTLSIIYTNEAISLVTMRSKELRLVQENHATVKLDLSIARRGSSESKIELRNLQILKKMMEK